MVEFCTLNAIFIFRIQAFDRLCNVRFTSVRAKINLSEVTINGRNGDFNPTSLAQVINTDTINNVVVRAWIDRAGE